MPRRLLALTATTTAAALLASCGSGNSGADDQGGPSIITSFYPLEHATQAVVGDVAGVTVESLTSPGADAHDLELTPRQVGSISDSDLVVFSSSMQPAVDEAVTAQAPDHSLDVGTVIDLLEPLDHEGHDHGADDGHDHAEDEEHAEDQGHAGHDHDGADPHFWLDPQRYATVAEAIADELAAVDPDHAETYHANAQAFSAELDALDQEFATALADCEHDTLVTTHEAFGYLADRYGLHQIGITGISPDAEASPARMAEITREVEDLGVPTIYAESSLGGDLADVIAQETGTEVLVLDPIESITGDSAGSDYAEVMRANLEALRQGQGCS